MTDQRGYSKQRFEENIQKKLLEQRDTRLRDNLSKMKTGKRVLLKDGRTGYFQAFSGDYFRGDTFEVNFNGVIENVSIRDYASVLIENENVKCLSCNSYHIMDGFLSGSYEDENISVGDITVRFKEKTTNTTSMNSRSVKCHACFECGFIMLFAQREG
jgi:hypothetical protein